MAIGMPAYEQIIEILRDEIISGDIPPDTRLTILDIAKRFGVSQMPVREAFQRLQGEGLIKGTPHKGVRVISIDAQFIRNIYAVRGAMEGILAADSYPKISTAIIKQLEDINLKLSKIPNDGKIDDILSLDRKFHMKIYEQSENSVALDIHNTFTRLLSRLRCTYGFGPYRLKELVEQHLNILKIFRQGDPIGLERLIRGHRKGSMVDLMNQISRKTKRQMGGGSV